MKYYSALFLTFFTAAYAMDNSTLDVPLEHIKKEKNIVFDILSLIKTKKNVQDINYLCTLLDQHLTKEIIELSPHDFVQNFFTNRFWPFLISIVQKKASFPMINEYYISKDIRQDSILHYIVSMDFYKINRRYDVSLLTTLLVHGINKNYKNAEGKTALDLYVETTKEPNPESSEIFKNLRPRSETI